MAKTSPVFTPRATSFLRALARNNDREWFQARKAEFEATVRDPMVRLIERLDGDFREFAPELVASPRVSMFRMYRDTRFSADKSPLKTAVGAVFPHRDLGKTEGAGLYLEIAPKHVLFAGGIHAPSSQVLRAVRQHVAANLRRFTSVVEAPAFRRATGGLQGDQGVRVPQGFAADHPAAGYLRYKQYLVWQEHPAAFASSPGFYAALLRFFRTAAPMIRFLNEPLVTGRAVDPLRPPRGGRTPS